MSPHNRLKRKLTISLCLAMTASVAQAGLYKCPLANGRSEFRDRPCDGAKADQNRLSIRPSSSSHSDRAGSAATPTGMNDAHAVPVGSTAPSPATPTTTFTQWGEEREAEAKEHQRKQRIYEQEQKRSSLLNQMNAELERLRNKKATANNNLAGATFEQSISSEMQAVTASYDVRIRSVDEELKRLHEAAPKP